MVDGSSIKELPLSDCTGHGRSNNYSVPLPCITPIQHTTLEQKEPEGLCTCVFSWPGAGENLGE